MIKGIDVSKHQGKIDFKAVRANGIDFVIIRAGFGRYIKQKDPYFEENYTNAKKAGLAVGAYWYSYANSIQEAVEEAKTCIEVIKNKQFEYPIFFDLEEPSQFKKGKVFCSNLVNAFCNELEKNGYFAGLYMSRSPLEDYIMAETAGKYALWVAEYNSKCNYKGSYGIWQYSSKGKIDGISGNVDLNYCYIDYAKIITQKGFNGCKDDKNSVPVLSDKLELKDEGLYVSASAKTPVKTISGIYYIYDKNPTNGRIRITTKQEYVGKKPIADYVTGWIEQ